MRINYLSDFKIREKSSEVDTTIPFTFTYKSGGIELIAEFNGTDYTNCERLDDGDLMVPFDGIGFTKIGNLYVKREYFLDDEAFADGICHLVTVQDTGIEFVAGETDCCDVDLIVCPNYQKGDPFLFEDFTPEQIQSFKQPAEDAAALANAAVDAMLSNLISLEIRDDLNLYFKTPDTYDGLEFDITNGNLIAII